MCDGKLDTLVKTGPIIKEELERVWPDIVAEYSEAMGSGEHKMFLNLLKQVGLLSTELKEIDDLVKTLGNVYSKKLADQLNVLVEASYNFDPADDKEYRRLLKACLDRSTSKKIDLKLKEDQLEEIQKKSSKPGKAPTVKYFNSILITLSDHAKYQITDDITVFEYCERISRLNKYLDSLKKR